MKKNKDWLENGFTLLEVLIAITITGLLIAVFADTFVQITQNQSLIKERVTAVMIGRGKLAELTYGSEVGLSGDFTEPYLKYHWTAAEESQVDGSKKIDITVKWRDGHGFSHQTKLVGYRYPE
jgi:prepilin-type N-terminal cleavage/methylation domain-containing protein